MTIEASNGNPGQYMRRLAAKILFPGSEEIHRLAETSELLAASLSQSLHAAFRERIAANLPTLHEIRRRVWQSSVSK